MNYDERINYYTMRVVNGISSINSLVAPVEWKERIAIGLVERLSNGEKNENITKAVVKYYISKLNKNEISISEIPEIIIDEVNIEMNKGS